MNKKHINLFLPSGNENVLEILRYLRKNKYFEFNIISCNIKGVSIEEMEIDKYYSSPPIRSDEYHKFITSLCKENKINVIVPEISDDALYFSKHLDNFRKIGAIPTVSNYKSCKVTTNKAECFSYLRKKGFAVPDFLEVKTVQEFKTAAKELGYPKNPICIKPSKYPNGSGKGFRIIDPNVNIHKRMFWGLTSEMYYVSYKSVIEAMENEVNFPPLLVMELLPGDEYSVYCFCEKGKCYYIVPNLRQTLIEMYSKDAVVKKNNKIEEMSRSICSLFGFDYNINIQIKYSKDRIPKIVEINPRLAGSILLPVAAGVDLVTFSILMALGEKFPKNLKIKYGTKMKRYVKDIYQYENKYFQL